MLFNSLEFLFFFGIVFSLYWFVVTNNVKLQNRLLLLSSLFFYGCWDWHFLGLLLFSIFLDFYTGLRIFASNNIRTRKKWFWISICVNLGFLGTFKYFNFFSNSFAEVMRAIGFNVSPWTISLILPVGISFYTFHGLSYVIDIYKKKIQPETNFVNYAVFVSFFPLLVAGPIERATHLLPQIQKKRSFIYSQAVDGLKQILWGLIKKVVIADNCAVFVDTIFQNSSDYNASTHLLAAIFFAFQIYGDFSGYSDMALGIARLFGIELLRNFAYPYFARDIAEFWRRWHISLSSWFRDYVYFPLGGSKGATITKVRNTFIIFIMSAFWHGANWTFLAWGLLNAIYFLPLLLLNKNRSNIEIVAQGAKWPTIKEFACILNTFGLVVFAWIFFRADSLSQAIIFISHLFSFSIFQVPDIFPKTLIGLVLLFISIEWKGRQSNFAIENIGKNWNRLLRYIFYYILIISIIWFGGKGQQFIYFQF